MCIRDRVTPDYKNVLMFIENLKLKLGLNDTYDIECPYEAGHIHYQKRQEHCPAHQPYRKQAGGTGQPCCCLLYTSISFPTEFIYVKRPHYTVARPRLHEKRGSTKINPL